MSSSIYDGCTLNEQALAAVQGIAQTQPTVSLGSIPFLEGSTLISVSSSLFLVGSW